MREKKHLIIYFLIFIIIYFFCNMQLYYMVKGMWTLKQHSYMWLLSI